MANAIGIDTFQLNIDNKHKACYKQKNAKFLCLWQTQKAMPSENATATAARALCDSFSPWARKLKIVNIR